MANGFDVLRQRQLTNLGFKAGGQPNFAGIDPASIISRFNADQALGPYGDAYSGDAESGLQGMLRNQQRSFGGGGQGLNNWGYGGYGVVPLPGGGYGIARGAAAPNGTGYGIHPNVPMDVYDASGKFMGSALTPAGLNPNDDSMKQFLIGAAMMAGPFGLAMAGAGGAAAGAAGASGVGGGGSSLAASSGVGGGFGSSLTGSFGTTIPAGSGFVGSGALDAAGIGGAGYGSAFGAGAGNLALDGAAAAGAGSVMGAAGGAGGATPQAMGAAGSAGGVPPNPMVAGAGTGGSSMFPSLGSLSSYIGPGASLVGGLLSSSAAKDAANSAAGAQMAAAQAGINEWARQFDTVRQLLGPYANTGAQAVGAQADLAGLNGADKQQAAVTGIQNMPAFQAQLKLGENRILQNAAATGGLRGGNTQGALAWFAPSLLAQQINDQYTRLGGLSGLGENAAAGVGNAAMTTAGGASGLMQQSGAAQAGADIAGGVADQKLYGSLSTALGQLFGYSGNPMISGVPTPV